MILAAAVWAVYRPALDAPFVFDDVGSIVRNESIKKLWPLTGEGGSFGPLTPPPYFSIAGRPVVNLTLAVNYHFGQLDPRYYHLLNIVVHFLSAVLLAAIVRRTLRLEYLSKRIRQRRRAVGLGRGVGLGAASFADRGGCLCHPADGIADGTVLLSDTVWQSSLLDGRVCRRWRHVARLATAACMAGMGCKEVMVSAPLVVLLFERAFVAGSLRRALHNSWPLYVGLALSWGVLLALNYNGPRSSDAGFHLGVAAGSGGSRRRKCC